MTADNQNPNPRLLSRRELLKLGMTAGLLTGSGLIAGSGLLTGCQPAAQLVTPTSPPSPTAAPPPTGTPVPSATVPPSAPSPAPTFTVTPVAFRRPEVIKMFPAAKSKVVHTHLTGVWSGKALVPNALRKMLDASITSLTGLKDARASWAALFAPNERIAVKVNAFSNSIIWTHHQLVKAVTDSLRDAGIPAEQIFVYDYAGHELKDAGFVINKDGPGVRIYGTDQDYSTGWRIGNTSERLSNVMLNADAIINMPILKSHMIAGTSFALKNHFGSVYSPGMHHYVEESIPALNGLPEIKNRTRLVIGDILEACINHANRYPYWQSDYIGDSILMSFDPVAHDTIGLDIFKKLKTAAGGDPHIAESMSTAWLKGSAQAGVGANDPKDIEVVEQMLK